MAQDVRDRAGARSRARVKLQQRSQQGAEVLHCADCFPFCENLLQCNLVGGGEFVFQFPFQGAEERLAADYGIEFKVQAETADVAVA